MAIICATSVLQLTRRCSLTQYLICCDIQVVSDAQGDGSAGSEHNPMCAGLLSVKLLMNHD